MPHKPQRKGSCVLLQIPCSPPGSPGVLNTINAVVTNFSPPFFLFFGHTHVASL